MLFSFLLCLINSAFRVNVLVKHNIESIKYNKLNYKTVFSGFKKLKQKTVFEISRGIIWHTNDFS